MKIISSAFGDNENIPPKYTCDEGDVIPPLRFENVPAETRSLVLIVEDPDAPMGTWDHWVVWNIPSDTRSIAEGVPPRGVFGKNSWGRNDWGGPCPPDREHRYFFKLYALNASLDLPAGSTKEDLQNTMSDKVLAEAQLVGRYDRSSRMVL